MNYLSLNTYLKQTFGCKVYKLAIDGGFTCPNRDGSLDTRGCIFCSGFGSGDFATSRNLSISEQIEQAKSRVENKINDGKYIAYFQAFTNTYAPTEELRTKYMEAISHKDVVAISIGTRPDCLSEEVLSLLEDLNKIKPIWVELGLQTIHNESAKFIRRGYDLPVYDRAVYELKRRGIYVITHVILGLPGETEEMILDTVRYVCRNISPDFLEKSVSFDNENSENELRIDGIKLQLLHIIKNTDLAYLYDNRFNLENTNPMRNYECMDMESYVNLVRKCIEIVPNTISIHRMTGDGDKKTLIAPLWSGDKKRVLNAINKALSD